MSKDAAMCAGCRENFYNGHNQLGVPQCWSLKTAKVVKRWKLGWWTTPDTPGAFQEVKTFSCHHETGKYAFYDKLPPFAVDPIRIIKAKQGRAA